MLPQLPTLSIDHLAGEKEERQHSPTLRFSACSLSVVDVSTSIYLRDETLGAKNLERLQSCHHQGARGLVAWAGRGISAPVQGGKRGFIGVVRLWLSLSSSGV